jgi:PKD repeat protein
MRTRAERARRYGVEGRQVRPFTNVTTLAIGGEMNRNDRHSYHQDHIGITYGTPDRLVAVLLGLFLVVLVAFGADVATAGAAVVNAPPTSTSSIPAGAPAGPPPIPSLPAATSATPPTDAITDPVTPSAGCGGWYLQSSYGDRWQAGSSWWEYQCTSSTAQYHNLCPGPACDAYCPDCYWETWQWTDYFYWDGSTAVFAGEAYSDTVVYDYQAYDNSLPFSSSFWWDGPTAHWYNLGPYVLDVSVQGTGSGEVSSSPAGISCGYYCEAAFDAGVVVTLTAVPDAGSSFTGWSGDCSGMSTCQVTVSQARSVTATFSPNGYGLTVTKQGSGSGQLSSTPAGISCGTSCQGSFDAGSSLTLTATPDADSVFIGWSGDCTGTSSCQLTMSQAHSVTASFATKTFTLTVTRQGSGSGQITSTPVGISCGTSCQAGFNTGTTVTLTATPAADSNFTGWSGDCSGSSTCQLTLTQARSVAASFATNQPPHASFTVTCTGLNCSFDASGSNDPDGSIANYAWNFGDGVGGNGRTTSHTYGNPGSYTATLTVTDNAGATANSQEAFNPISVSARGYKQNGHEKVDLSWSGDSAASFDIYRNGGKSATVQALAYTDNLNTNGTGTYSYRICATGGSVCSNQVTVSF